MMQEIHTEMKTELRHEISKATKLYPLQLDFYDTRRRTSWPNRMLLLGGILVVALMSFQFVETQTAIGSLQSQQAVLEQTHHHTRKLHLTPEQAQNMRAELKDAKTVLSQLNLPWGQLFQDIGASQQNEVALLSIVPDVPKHTIKLSGEAKDLTSVLNYIQSLQRAKSLGPVYLQNHHVETRSAQQPVRFTLLATWLVKP